MYCLRTFFKALSFILRINFNVSMTKSVRNKIFVQYWNIEVPDNLLEQQTAFVKL